MKSLPISIDRHYSTRFIAEWWGVSEKTVVREFQDREGVLKLGDKRVELRIPGTLAQKVYEEKTR